MFTGYPLGLEGARWNTYKSSELDTLLQLAHVVLIFFYHQWINCDIRQLDMTVLGKFSVIMADPPWDIHMELPYGTMSDDEMRRMNIPCLQDDGYIFLWVTGRYVVLPN